MRGRYGNQVHLRDRLRVRLEKELKFSESMGVDRKTSFIDFCRHLSLDPETSTWRMVRAMLGEKFIGGNGGGGPPTQCYLVDRESGTTREFRSIKYLLNHLGCYIHYKGGRCSPGPSIIASTREGCIITHRDREKYITPSLDVDFTTLDYCKSNCLNIRLVAQNIGLPVHTYSSVEDIARQIPIVETEGICTREMLCNYFGLKYNHSSRRGSDTTSRRTTILSHTSILTFDSISGAARYLKVSAKTLRKLHDEALPCPYRGVEYWVEIED